MDRSFSSISKIASFFLRVSLLVVLVLSLAAAPLLFAAESAAPSSGLGRVFITNTGSDSVSVIDDATNALLTTIAVGSRPIRIVANANGTRAYVSNFGGSSVSVIDTVRMVVIHTIIVPLQPQESAITPDGSRLYVVH